MGLTEFTGFVFIGTSIRERGFRFCVFLLFAVCLSLLTGSCTTVKTNSASMDDIREFVDKELDSEPNLNSPHYSDSVKVSGEKNRLADQGRLSNKKDISSQDNVYRIGVDDVIQVSVWRNPDLSVTVPVRPDGMISIPLIGDVAAGGLTPEEVGRGIEEELAIFVRDPKVSIILTQLVSHQYLSRVRVTGAVINPVSIPFRQGMTVLDLVLEAGGINEFAAANKTHLYRTKNRVTEHFNVRLKDILRHGELETNYPVLPGDIVTVPERKF